MSWLGWRRGLVHGVERRRRLDRPGRLRRPLEAGPLAENTLQPQHEECCDHPEQDQVNGKSATRAHAILLSPYR
jgi:hypothetical protein